MWYITAFKYLVSAISILSNAVKVYQFADENNLWTKTKLFFQKVKGKFTKK